MSSAGVTPTTPTSGSGGGTRSSSQTLLSCQARNDHHGRGHGRHPWLGDLRCESCGGSNRWFESGFFRSRGRTTTAIVLGLIVLMCVVFLCVYFAMADSNGADDSAPATSPSGRFVLPVMQTDWMPRCPSSADGSHLQVDFVDCHPEAGQTRARCERRGCCWIDQPSTRSKMSVVDPPSSSRTPSSRPSSVPAAPPPPPLACVYPANYGYVVSGPEEQFADGWEMPLVRLHVPSRYGDDVHALKVRVEMQTPTRLRVKFYNPSSDQDDGWAEPEANPSIPQLKIDLSKVSPKMPKLYALSYDRSSNSSVPFGLQVRRVETGTVIFNSSMSGLTFSSQFLQMAIKLPSQNVYGLGPLMPTDEDQNRNFSAWPTWSLFASHTLENQTAKIHGGHPLYMCLEDDGRAHAVLLHSSYPVDMQLLPTPHMTYRALGGSLDFYIFLGPTPEDVAKQYTEAVGRPFLPPYWALGFQVSYVGASDLDSVKESLRDLEKYNISYDVVSLGSEYMNNGIDFTVDYRRFPNLLVFKDELGRAERYLDVDLDPALSQEQPLGTYPAYDEGLSNGVFVNDSLENGPITGKTSSGKSVFVDFGSHEIDKWWTRNLKRLHGLVRFESLSLVENYPSNWRDDSSDHCLKDNFNHPPYLPRALANSRLYWHTICMDGIQRQSKRKVRHYSSHNTYGHQMAHVTYRTLSDMLANQNSRRPMVVSQSTFTGSGAYTAFWAMDNARTWSYLRKSIDTMLSYNLYGMPLVGSAICGMDVPADEGGNELCTRWMQLGAFYPLARMVQDPLFCEKDFSRAASKAITDRYTLLPYLYHLFYKATTEGSTVARPLFHEFYWDKNTYNISTQFMWGSSLMIAPVLSKETHQMEVYLPHGLWYMYHTGGRIETCGEWISMESPLDRIILLVRGGAIIPTQTAGLTTAESRKNNFHLIVALDGNYTASGQLFWDDGVSKDTILNKEYVLVNFTVEKNKLTVSGEAMKPFLPSSLTSAYFASVDILGLPSLPLVVSILGTEGVLGTRQLSWEPRAKVAKLREINLPFSTKVEIYWRWTEE